MKCTNCGYDNAGTAYYCHNCGHAFEQTQRDLAYNKTIWHKIDRLIEAKQFVTFEKFTGNTIVRIIILAAVLIYGLFLMLKNGNSLMVKPGEDYQVSYNQNLNEYYIETDQTSFTLSVYVPRKSENIILSAVDSSGNIVSQTVYQPEDQIVLNSEQDRHYTLSADYGGSSETLTIFVLENMENE